MLVEPISKVRSSKKDYDTSSFPSGLNIALAHDWLVGMRGGENVLDRIARITGPTDLYTMLHDRNITHSPAIESCRIHTSSLQNWPGAVTNMRRWYLPAYPRAVESLTIPDNKYDLLISTSSAVIKSIKPPLGKNGKPIPHICYCHTPARYLWEQTHEYDGSGFSATLRGLGLKMLGPSLRKFDQRTSENITTFIANSTHTAKRIERAYNRSALVIHPPVDVDFYTIDSQVKREPCYLVVSALEPYKRVDLAVRAAVETGIKLKIAGTGSEMTRLKKLARGKSTIKFLGLQNSRQLRTLYRNAKALLFPGMEDFGIVPVEALACGCPVIAYHQGGAQDWWAPGCGLLFKQQTVENLTSALTEFDHHPADYQNPKTCRNQSTNFSSKKFNNKITNLIKSYLPVTR